MPVAYVGSISLCTSGDALANSRMRGNTFGPRILSARESELQSPMVDGRVEQDAVARLDAGDAGCEAISLEGLQVSGCPELPLGAALAVAVATPLLVPALFDLPDLAVGTRDQRR